MTPRPRAHRSPRRLLPLHHRSTSHSMPVPCSYDAPWLFLSAQYTVCKLSGSCFTALRRATRFGVGCSPRVAYYAVSLLRSRWNNTCSTTRPSVQNTRLRSGGRWRDALGRCGMTAYLFIPVQVLYLPSGTLDALHCRCTTTTTYHILHHTHASFYARCATRTFRTTITARCTGAITRSFPFLFDYHYIPRSSGADHFTLLELRPPLYTTPERSTATYRLYTCATYTTYTLPTFTTARVVEMLLPCWTCRGMAGLVVQ